MYILGQIEGNTMTKDTQAKTQPTKPSAGALRAAKQIAAERPEFTIEAAAMLIDRETGAAELLEALRAIIYPNNERHIEFDSRREYYVAQIEGGEYHRAMQAITKCESGTGSE